MFTLSLKPWIWKFALLFGRLRQRMLLKSVPHVQHDYFSSFNQSDHCFLVLSLPLPLPLPSSLLKLPSREIWGRQRQRQRRKPMIWLVEWGKIIGLHVQRTFWCNFLLWSVKLQREIFIFEVLTTTPARSRKSLILCLYMKTIRAKQAKVHFA